MNHHALYSGNVVTQPVAKSNIHRILEEALASGKGPKTCIHYYGVCPVNLN